MKNTLLIIANITNTHTHRFIHEFQERGWDVFVASIQPPNSWNERMFGENIIEIPTYGIYMKLINLPFFKYSEFHNVNSGVKWYEPYSISSVFSYLYLVLFIKKITRKLNPEAIFTIYLTMNGFLAGMTSHRRIVSSAAGADVSRHRFLSLDYFANHPAILRFAARRSRKVIGFDQKTFEPMFQEKGCSLGNVVWMAHWGVQTERFLPLHTSRRGGERCKLICSRPYRPQFDFESILNVLKRIHLEDGNIEFIIASGAQSDKNIESLMKTIQKTGCMKLDFIKILKHIDYSKLPEVIGECDVYIDPINIHKFPETKGWGVSGSLLEAMSCGLIPVISRRPGVDWILPPESTPFVYDSYNYNDGLYKALKNAINIENDIHIRDAMRRAVLQKANWKRNMDIIESFFVEEDIE